MLAFEIEEALDITQVFVFIWLYFFQGAERIW